MRAFPRLCTLIPVLVVALLAPVGAQRPIDLDSATIADLIAAFNAGTVTSENLVARCLARIDTAGPMARSVYDVAVSLGVMTGIDASDAATRKSEGRFETDYTKFLRADP